MSDSAADSHGRGPVLDLSGRVLDGRYRVEAQLGAGGMGAVYRAWHLALEKRVAIKVLKPDYAGREDAVKRFLREARAASKIGHANVVEVLDFGHEGELVYFVMEFLEGEDLAHLVRREAPLPWRKAKRILLQIVRALKAAHAKGIVHRDVKPANCFIVRDEDEPDRVKVLDFGIAKVLAADNAVTEGLTSTSQVMGTALYMAPEQAMGQTIDARTDVYAVGVMAFEMLTGRPPFTGATTFEVVMKRMNEPPPLLRAFRPALGPGVETLLQRAMARDPVARHQTMKELEAALVEIPDDLEGDVPPLVPRPDTRPEAAFADAVPTATSARHRAAGANVTMPYAEGAVQSDRLVELLAAGDPTQAGTRAPSSMPVPTEIADTGVAAPRAGGQALALVAGLVVALALGGGAWWLFGRDAPQRGETIASGEVEGTREAAKNEDARASAGSADDENESAAEGKGAGAANDENATAKDPDASAVEAKGDDANAAEANGEEAGTRESESAAHDDANADEAKHDPSRDGDAKTTGARPKSVRDKTPKPLTDAAVIGRLRKKARSSCTPATAAAQVTVQFFVEASGATAMVKGSGDGDLVACVVGLVEQAQFPPGEPRPGRLTVAF